MKKHMSFVLVALFAIVFAACSKSADSPATPPQADNAAKVREYILKLGFHENQIVDHPTEFMVEGDISFPKNMKVPEGNIKTEQYYTGSKVTNVTNIRLRVDASLSGLSAEIDSAISQWNAISSCSVNWVLAPTGTYDVLMTNANLGNGICGAGTFPVNGVVGNLIRINAAYIAGNNFAQRARTITHELGHNISFRHTNWAAAGENPPGVDVPGVPGTDASSLMNAGQCGIGATVLSVKDIKAAQSLYP
ncbi:hypothetical protein HHL17_21120 [Chitinophaga sp. G-6-1-13]|uniref:Dual-action HEIGH metallo-peptidase n=1 Tax=Chitinophaga fulva TaxID=2728842 RepID=A0A848GMT0_9BACT|nr:M57 family metalloprotease [Chitinophaga fulva]NML39714.1 hypothetical protein [Chitinophaga fulva]